MSSLFKIYYKLRQAVSFSLSKDFNVVAADLKSINCILILHMIDHATRYFQIMGESLVKTCFMC